MHDCSACILSKSMTYDVKVTLLSLFILFLKLVYDL